MSDELFPELMEAMRETLAESGQDDQFQRQFLKLVANAYENNAERRDVERLLDALELDSPDEN